MPPLTRRKGFQKTMKNNENNQLRHKNTKCKVTKHPRKALSDKTNSASDDNSVEVPFNKKKAVSTGVSKVVVQNEGVRPRRQRRLPSRFVENHVLTNLSNSKEIPVTPISKKVEIVSPPKNYKSRTPTKLETSLIAPRPKRICKLPPRLENHSISPNKSIPVHPCHASTPIQQNKGNKIANKCVTKDKPVKKVTVGKTKLSAKKVTIQKQIEKPKEKSSQDTNNNPKTFLHNKPIPKTSIIKLNSSNSNTKKPSKRLLENNFSFKVLEDKKKLPNHDQSNNDVYEFTFDPEEEPPPQKKKRKRVVKKKLVIPKPVFIKSNYDHNVSKALNALKNVIKKPPVLQNAQSQKIINDKGTTGLVNKNGNTNILKEKVPTEIPNIAARETKPASIMSNPVENVVSINNHVSIQIEDIAADFEPIVDYHHEAINYSPVSSPNRPVTPKQQSVSPARHYNDNDPLNLQGDLSFFDEQPVASSSMNVSVRNPLARPWRVEFGKLPIKWQSDTYVKSNMTPAVESSFIHFDDSNKKKHVYTNLLTDAVESLQQIVASENTHLKQTSIISFMRDVAERSASKRKRATSVTPSKANSLFEDNVHVDIRTPMKISTKNDIKPSTPNKSGENLSNNSSNNSSESQNNNTTDSSKSSKQKASDKDKTYFGFDDSENLDQENVSPVKVNPRVRALRPRSRAVLQEINAQSGPMRAALPLAAKTKLASSDAVNKVYEQLKAADAPTFPENNTAGVVTTNIGDQSCYENEDNDDESVHLFEDIEVIHHLKPTRKSYGKAKKVTFRQMSSSNGDTDNAVAETQVETSEEDDLADLSFHVPTMKEKRIVKKKKSNKKIKISKKEKKEVDEWAAGFNSMCEEIEDFPLLVE